MSFFNSKEAAYTKIEYDANPPAYIQATNNDDTVNQSPEVPKTTYQSRFSEPIYFVHNQEHNNNQTPAQNSRSIISANTPKTVRNYCKLIANISLIVGIALLLLSVIFKVQSTSYIRQAVATGCPANCITTCYDNLPFYRPSIDCDSSLKQTCDEQCISAGMDQATTFAILFYVFIGLGALLMVLQITSNCLRYCFFDYIEYKKNNQVGDISKV